MWVWIHQNSNEISAVFTVFAFALSLGALAFSAVRYVSVRRDELQNQRYERYHALLRHVSTGVDINGMLKLVSQRAYIYELRHFPEYSSLTIRLLESLLEDWKVDPEQNAKLELEARDTILALK
jgi:hypothetical protein